MSDEASEQHDVSPRRAAEMIASGECRVVDVREPSEWEESRLPGAVHIPLDALPHRAAEIAGEGAVIFLCRSGARSGMATAAFRASGVEAYNLAGGLEAWAAEGLEVEPADGGIAGPRPDNS